MMHLFLQVGMQCSKIVTEKYSTSFSSAIRLLGKTLRPPIYNIYGFVRFADEIVDTFHQHDKKELLSEFKLETYNAIKRKISLNPILHSFQQTFHDYNINLELVDSFFKSMETDLERTYHDSTSYNEYIYGSAEVVGLMCLTIFCQRNVEKFNELAPFARSLGAAFQKVNFLRDIKSDYQHLERTYFPGVDFDNFTTVMKNAIEREISLDFSNGYIGITMLPAGARFGVYVAYKYYLSLFNKIKRTKAQSIMDHRIRIPNYSKAFILMRAGVKNQLKLI
ncbi:MAG: phytoene/squalene synthase family protein [Ginsengibacter sp.]